MSTAGPAFLNGMVGSKLGAAEGVWKSVCSVLEAEAVSLHLVRSND